MVIDPSHPTSSTSQSHIEAETQSGAARARATSALVFNTKGDPMAYLISIIHGMGKTINELLLNQKSYLTQIMKTKFHDLDVKVTELYTTVNQSKQEVVKVTLPRSEDDYESPTLLI
ncbi:hypothetical protein D1007_56645 [Hordeum vulgare]|nr:hypothetical protein D1007_56645 [Hordeum vulgare]